jgi:transposase
LERFKNRAEEILIFMEIKDVPFTNNCAELAHRMLKVHQKISGCFKGITGAKIACRIRSYIDTCRKNNVPAIEALEMLFRGEKPDFMNSS